VTSAQIYAGSIPFVIIQLIMVGLVIAFPYMVTHYRTTAPAVDPSTIRIDVPMPGAGGPSPADNPFGGPASPPDFGAPAVPGGSGAPDFGAPPKPGGSP
jgi:hypothetical protein